MSCAEECISFITALSINVVAECDNCTCNVYTHVKYMQSSSVLQTVASSCINSLCIAVDNKAPH